MGALYESYFLLLTSDIIFSLIKKKGSIISDVPALFEIIIIKNI